MRSSSPRTKPRASSASRAGMPRPRAASARARISPRWASPSAATATAERTTSLDGHPLRIAGLGLEAGAQRLHRRRPDPAHLVELVDGGEAAVLFAELDDVLCRDRTDPVDRVQLLDGGRAEADRPSFARRSGR